jgi:hypothetical protein
MARTETQVINFIRMVFDEHCSYWEEQVSELKKYKDAYANKFWRNEELDDTMIRVETSDAYAYIEGYIASLFSKAPAIEVGTDEAVPGDPKLAKAVANRFLYNQREHFEDGSRMALIFNNSFFKLSPRESDNILDKVGVKACPCWELIVDKDASSWETQRFVGHTYYITIPEAKERFGSKKYSPVGKKDYFEDTPKSVNPKQFDLPEEYLYIQVVELYDLLYDEMYFWSPNYGNGQKLLDKDVIPVRTYDDRPLPPIAPLYYARVPDRPLEGMSAMSRVYDQVYEKNILRTYWANSVRRDSRQYLYKEGALDAEQLAKITAGIDGAMIGVDEESLDGLIREVSVTPVSSNFDRYLAQIEADLSRGSILAPFTRGEATNATATEVTALAQYTASEIGKMARDRDAAIEMVADIYIRILSFLAEEGEKAVISVDGSAKVVTPGDLDSKFKIVALDQGSQPIADALKRENLINLLPILTQLGVPPHTIREEVIRAWDLPESFLETAQQQAAREEQEEAVQKAAEEAMIGPRSIPGELAQPATGGQPEAAQALATELAGQLPTGG